MSNTGIKSNQRGNYVETVIMRIFEQNYRRCNRPKELDRKGQRRGRWVGNKFVFYDDYVPAKFNSTKKTMRQIKDDLQKIYGIEFDGICYINGLADFSSVSICRIGLDEIVMAKYGINKEEYKNMLPVEHIELEYELFRGKNRTSNFKICDKIMAEKKVKIVSLNGGYSSIKKFRKKNGFQWHEDTDGFYLVPAVIHGNLGHLGLIGRTKGVIAITKGKKNLKLTKK